MEFKDLAKEQRLGIVCDSILSNLPNQKKGLNEGRTNEKFIALAAWDNYQKFALKSFFIDNDINKTKNYFSYCGKVDELLINKYDEKILDYGIYHISYTLLSDHQDLINRYANLSHSNYDKMIQGGTATPMYILQCIIKEDWDAYNRTMPTMKAKTAPKFKMQLDYDFFEALAEKNKTKLEEILGQLVTPKEHKRRNKFSLINEFISHPATGYAKLAWLKGIEVEVNSPLVPKELLPIAPLPVYTDEYDFLKKEELLK